jgi:hypothetical protein
MMPRASLSLWLPCNRINFIHFGGAAIDGHRSEQDELRLLLEGGRATLDELGDSLRLLDPSQSVVRRALGVMAAEATAVT